MIQQSLFWLSPATNSNYFPPHVDTIKLAIVGTLFYVHTNTISNRIQVRIMSQTAMDLVQAAKAVINEITVEQAQEMLANDCLFLDVREQAEYDAGHILHAKHISRGMLEFKISVHPDFKDMTQPVVVYCKTGGRSALATQTLMSLGFTNVNSLLGGFDAWATTHAPSQA